MYDSGKIITGLIVFLVLVTFPVWYNLALGKTDAKPELKKVENQTQCVMDKEYMKAWHMDLLNQWRNSVVRTGDMVFASPNGKSYEKSLVNTCMKCHTAKSKFCDQCHNYAAVTNDCWDCHINPEGK